MMFSALALAALASASAKEIAITTHPNDSGLQHRAFVVITSGSDFPSIQMECRSLDGSLSAWTTPTIHGPVPTEEDITYHGPGKYIPEGNCGFVYGDDTWRNVPTCWLVERVSFCENSKGIFCGTAHSHGDAVAVRHISVAEGDSVSLSLAGAASIASDYDGYCHTAVGNDATVTSTGSLLEVVYPSYTEPHWAVTLKDMGTEHPGCSTCVDGCIQAGSELDVCAESYGSTINPSIDMTFIGSTGEPSADITYALTGAPSTLRRRKLEENR